MKNVTFILTAWSSNPVEDYTWAQAIRLWDKVESHRFPKEMWAWLYVGPEWEGLRGEMLFNPFTRPECLTLFHKGAEQAEREQTDDCDDWKRERAMQAGMMGGCEAYNSELGYIDFPYDDNEEN